MQVGKASNRRIDEVLEMIDLRDRASHAYRTYSLGMKERLGIGAALLTDPELILLDEPTNGLDPEGVHAIRELILRLAHLGKTVFLTSHLLNEVQQVCNRVAILHKGHLLRQGNVQELLHHERIVVHMQTAEETEQVHTLLQQVQTHAPWITGVSMGTDSQHNDVVHVDAPTTRSPELAAILALRQLFAAEVYHYQASLEEFYLDVTSSPAGEGAQAGTALSAR
jgi:ABC-2 type transport system ATP-binding protein